MGQRQGWGQGWGLGLGWGQGRGQGPGWGQRQGLRVLTDVHLKALLMGTKAVKGPRFCSGQDREPVGRDSGGGVRGSNPPPEG